MNGDIVMASLARTTAPHFVLFSDLDGTVRRWIERGRSFDPDGKKHESYRPKIRRYEALVEMLNTFSVETIESAG